jgi:hypothetical protein
MMADGQTQVPYVKGRLPNTEIQAMVRVAQALFEGLYPDSTKTANRKTRAFKASFVPALKRLIDRWNNEAKAYYPNGRARKNHDPREWVVTEPSR